VNRRAVDHLQALGASEYVAAKAVEALVASVLEQLGGDLGDDEEWVKTCFRPSSTRGCHSARAIRAARTEERSDVDV
jgi:hypothetical protein